MYKVVNYFEDLKDSRHKYNVGDIFPRIGTTVSEERLKELSSSNNRQKKPLIALVKDDEVKKDDIKEEKKYTKTEIFHMSTVDLQVLAKEKGIENAEEKTGSELKKLLVKHFGL